MADLLEQIDMEQPTGIKLCECGCGQPAPIAKKNDSWNGYVKGQPLRFIQGHSNPARNLFVEVGQRFGQGVVIEAEIRVPGRQQGNAVTFRGVRLLCDCGNEYTTRLDSLSAGHSLSCGCRRGRYGGKSDPERVAKNYLLRVYQRNAKVRDLAWSLTDEDFYRLILLECHYCGQPPVTTQKIRRRVKDGERRRYQDSGFAANGLDRVDNAAGYTLENVVACCETCNRAKHAMSYGEFMAWIARLTDYHWFHPELMPSRLLKEVMQA